jgi:transcription antitermination factor NusG
MNKIVIVAALTLVLAGCSSPDDIVLGPEPLKQLAEQGDKFKRMPEEDRMLLVGYLSLAEMGKAFGKETVPVAGRTVAEVMKDARAWKAKVKAAEVEQEKRDAEALVLRKKIEAENKKVADQIADMVTVAVTDKVVKPKNYDVGRYSELLMIKYAVENKTEKTIRQIKGIVSFVDPSGDPVGSLHVDIDNVLKPGATVRTDTGSGWRTNSFSRGEIEKIAERDFSAMSGTFKVTSIAFAGGEVLKLAD